MTTLLIIAAIFLFVFLTGKWAHLRFKDAEENAEREKWESESRRLADPFCIQWKKSINHGAE